jgi:hypothetical protein
MSVTEANSDRSDPVHDFAWRQMHRARRNEQIIEIVILAGWAVLVVWVLCH